MDEMHWKTAMPAAGVDQQKGSNSSPWQCSTAYHTTNGSKVEEIGLQSFGSSAIFTWPLANLLLLLQASWQLFVRNTSTTSRRQKMLSKSLSNPKAQILCYKNKQTYFLLAKMYWLWWFLFLLIKRGIMTISLFISVGYKNLCFRSRWTLGKHFLPPDGCGSVFPAKCCWYA